MGKKEDQHRWYMKHKRKHKQTVLEYKREFRDQNKNRVREYLVYHPCIDCGEDDIVVLDFDHKDGEKKKATISFLLGQGYSWKTIEEEINKCVVRCANCHRRRTSIQFGWFKAR
jgi:hypothetical protein